MFKFLSKYNLKKLKKEINEYGYTYSNYEFIKEALMVILAVVIVSYISQLKFKSMIFLIGLSFLMLPFMVSSWFLNKYHYERFAMISDYLSNVLPIFMQKPKIRFTLQEALDLTHGKMAKTIKEAIDYIDYHDDAKANANALKIIEDAFPNSRIKSVHKLMISIEEENSKDYLDVAQNLYFDIENWIKRLYSFHKDLMNRRNKLLILCLLTLGMNALFIYLYVSNEYFIGFTDSALYQVSTTAFVAMILFVMVLIITRLHGEWLVNDLVKKDEKLIQKAYDTVMNGQTKVNLIEKIFGIGLGLAGLYVLYQSHNYSISLSVITLAYIVFTHKYHKYQSALKRINKALTLEFPMWLREISLSLHNNTVVNAINASYDNASYPMRKEIEKFEDRYIKDPISIKAFASFLESFKVTDAKSSMKVLYTMQNLGEKETKNQISSLIMRNQTLLDRSETIRNNDSIIGVEAIGYLPILIFVVQMLCSMLVMFGHMMTKLNGVMMS